MSNSNYHPESYWSEVAQRIKTRGAGDNVIAGDDEPYYRYKRKKFLELLNSLDFTGKSVMELGCGPGGNLKVLEKQNISRLIGVDISEDMIRLSRSKLSPHTELIKIDGEHIPFEDKSIDMSITATVLQHNTDDRMMKQILKELARVTSSELVLFERVEKTIKGDELCLGRPVDYYSEFLKSQGFNLKSTRFINIRVSYYVCGAIRKLLNPSSRKEGEAMTALAVLAQKIVLPITSILDNIFTSNTDVCRMIFIRS